MATELSWNKRLWRGIVSHKPLKRHIDWWLRGLAICAVPMIIACTVIIGCELAAPDWFSKDFGLTVATLTEDLLNAAIEGSMLGCIALSKQARKDGNNKQAYTMTALGWIFAALTVITVGFRVFHASPDAGTVLLWVRCGAGIAFCYLSHLFDDDDAEEVTPHQHRTQMEQLTETFNQQVQQLTTTFNQQIQQVTVQLSSVQNHLTEAAIKGLNDVQLKEIESTFGRLIERHTETLNQDDSLSIESIQSIVNETHAAFQSAFTERLSAVQSSLSALPDLHQRMAYLESELKRAETAPKATPRPTEKEVKAPLKFVRKESTATEIDKKAFVIECLTEDSTMTISEIQRRATERGFSVSVGTISTVRKDFNESLKGQVEDSAIAPVETANERQTEDSAVGKRVS